METDLRSRTRQADLVTDLIICICCGHQPKQTRREHSKGQCSLLRSVTKWNKNLCSPAVLSMNVAPKLTWKEKLTNTPSQWVLAPALSRLVSLWQPPYFLRQR